MSDFTGHADPENMWERVALALLFTVTCGAIASVTTIPLYSLFIKHYSYPLTVVISALSEVLCVVLLLVACLLHQIAVWWEQRKE